MIAFMVESREEAHSRQSQFNRLAAACRGTWSLHRVKLLRFGVLIMAVAAVVWLGHEYSRLLWQPGRDGPIDLRLLRKQSIAWVAGIDTYAPHSSGLYPPASYPILWLAEGWMEETAARWVWAVSTLFLLVWLIYLVIDAVRPESRLEALFLALIPLSGYATGETIGNGQLALHIVPPLIAGTLWLTASRSPSASSQGNAPWAVWRANILRYQTGWLRDLLGAAMILIGLVKPSIAAPFFWIVLFVPRRLRPAILVLVGYVLLTGLAVSFQKQSPLALIQAWLTSSQRVSTIGSSNLTLWLGDLGLNQLILPAAATLVIALGIWIWLYRGADVWLLLGVSAIVARFWLYHWPDDDVILIVPLITLLRIVKRGAWADAEDVIAGLLAFFLLMAMVAPGVNSLFPSLLNTIYADAQVIIWLVVLGFLMVFAARDHPVPAARFSR